MKKSPNSINSEAGFIRWGFVASFLAILVTFPLASGALGSPIRIIASISPESLTVGDRFLYVNTIENALGRALQPIPMQEKLGDATVLSPVVKLAKSPKGTVSYSCTLAVYQPGPAKIPAFAFRHVNSPDTTLYTGDTLTVNIASVLPPDTTGVQMADIRGPRRLRGPVWPYFVIAAALALLVFAGAQLKNRWQRKVAKPEVPPIPPWDLAFQRLDALKAERHLDFGRFRQFYFELSLIIRGYIEGRYETMAVESTTYELENDSALETLRDDLYSRLFEFFERADLVKFAKAVPNLGDAQADLQFGYDFVSKTKPLTKVSTAVKSAPAEVKA